MLSISYVSDYSFVHPSPNTHPYIHYNPIIPIERENMKNYKQEQEPGKEDNCQTIETTHSPAMALVTIIPHQTFHALILVWRSLSNALDDVEAWQ